MTLPDDAGRHDSVLVRVARKRSIRFTATGLAVGLMAGTIVAAGGGTAGAATPPNAQSVGRFLDGTAGGMPIQQLADLVDARAKAAPDTTQRNPLDAKLAGQLDVPVGNALQLPGGGALSLGAANQIAVAKTDGYSYGASGAVSNTGGADLADDQGAYPSTASANLSSALLGSTAIPGLPAVPGLPTIPGLPTGDFNAAALGGLSANIGATAALAQTKSGGAVVTPRSTVAGINLTLTSPALGALLAQLKGLLDPTVLTDALSAIPGLSALLATLPPVGTHTGACALTSTSPSKIYLDSTGGKASPSKSVVTVDATSATITINVGALVQSVLGKDISNLDTSNFDLISFLVEQLPTILSKGLEDTITGITTPLSDQFSACTTLLGAGADAVKALITSGQNTLLGAINGVAGQLSSAGAAPLAALADGLKNAVDIGLNVQSGPGIAPHDKTYPFESDLAATPDQATPVVKNQTLVRAIEIDLLNPASLPAATGLPGLGSLPGTSSLRQTQLAGSRAVAAAAPGGGAAVLALGNAAAGPSSPAAAPTTTAPSSSAAAAATGTALPTGVPAGLAGHDGGGSPALPIALVLIGLVLAGGGVMSYRMRGKFNH